MEIIKYEYHELSVTRFRKKLIPYIHVCVDGAGAGFLWAPCLALVAVSI